MISTCKLVGLYVHPAQARDLEGQRSLVPGFAVEIIDAEGREKPGGGRSGCEGQVVGVGRRETKPARPYCTTLRETMRHWWGVESCGVPVPEELLEDAEGTWPKEEGHLVS